MTNASCEMSFDVSANLNDLVKKILLAFCEVHVTFFQRLDIYGSIHVRSDDNDLTSFVLNEHCYKQETDLSNGEAGSVLTKHVSSANGNATTVQTVYHHQPSLNSASKTQQKARSLEADSPAKPSSGEQGGGRHDVPASILPAPRRRIFERFGGAKCGAETAFVSREPRRARLVADAENVAAEEGSDGLHDDDATEVKPGASFEQTEEEEEEGNMSRDVGGNSAYNSVREEDDIPRIHDHQIKAEREFNDDDGRAVVKFEQSIENDVIDLGGSDEEESYDRSGTDGLYPTYDSSVYNSGLYQGFMSAAVGMNPSVLFPCATTAWMPNDASSYQTPAQNDAHYKTSKRTVDSSGTVVPASEKLCTYCLKCFATNIQLKLHVQRYHRPSAAPESTSSANVVPGWRRRPHALAAPAPAAATSDADAATRQLTCSVCSLTFRSLDGLRCHENSKHSRNKLYRCQFCAQIFLTRQAAYTHRTKFHRLTPKKTAA